MRGSIDLRRIREARGTSRGFVRSEMRLLVEAEIAGDK